LTLALHIALLSHYAVGYDASGLAFTQMLSITLVFALFWPLFEAVVLPSGEVWIALIATGLEVSAGAFWVQTFVQRCCRWPGRR